MFTLISEFDFFFDRSRKPGLTTGSVCTQRYWLFCTIDLHNFCYIHLLDTKGSVAGIPTKLPSLGTTKTPIQLLLLQELVSSLLMILLYIELSYFFPWLWFWGQSIYLYLFIVLDYCAVNFTRKRFGCTGCTRMRCAWLLTFLLWFNVWVRKNLCKLSKTGGSQ